MLPHVGLALRAARDINPKKLLFHAGNNITTNLFQPSNNYGDEFIAPNSVYVEPTMICNRRCTGCYPEKLGVQSKIPNNVAQQAFDVSRKFGIHYVAWIGGEPLIPYAQEVTLGLSEVNPDVAVVICTNGDFIDDKVAGRIGDVHNIVPFISVDGPKEVHDRRRGAGSYQNATRAMRLLKDRKAMIGYSTTIHSGNFHEVSSEQFVDQMIENGAFIGFYTVFISNSPHEYQLTPEQLALAIDRLNILSAGKPLYILSTDHGRLNGSRVIKGKRLMGITIDPWGGVRTERGGPVIDGITSERDLEKILTSAKFQAIFRSKSNGEETAPYDSGRAQLRQDVFTLLSD